MRFQQTLYNVEDTVTDFQHKAHKSAILCPPRHMKENLWASGFYVAIKQNTFNLVRACTCSCLCASALSLSLLLFFFLVKAINTSVFLQISSVQTFVTNLSIQPLAKQNGSSQEIEKFGLLPSVSCAICVTLLFFLLVGTWPWLATF